MNDGTEGQLSADPYDLGWPDSLKPNDLNRDVLVVYDSQRGKLLMTLSNRHVRILLISLLTPTN